MLLFPLIALIIGCSNNSDVENRETDGGTAGQEMDSTDTVNSPQTIDSTETGTSILFTVIGDVPYNNLQRDSLISLIDAHNALTTSQNTGAKSEFVVHVGDIKPGADDCDESVYADINGLLKNFETPTFIVLGDNEYNDCANPGQALDLWNQYFLHFNENWDFPHEVEYQEKRPENFSWVQGKVLFMGLNLVGSSVHDAAEWNRRLSDDAEWVERQLNARGESIDAMVLFGHANMTEAGPDKFVPFTDRFRAAAKNFGKPVLYLQGDGHFWFRNRPWPENNILRVQIQGGGEAVQVTVNPSLGEPFQFDREFLD